MRECFAELEIWPGTMQRNADARSMRSIANGLEPAAFLSLFSGAAPSINPDAMRSVLDGMMPLKMLTAPLLC
jgi:hypothetical protein